MTFGDQIRSLRVAKGLTQAELGERCGWPDSRIGAYERNEVKKPTVKSINKLADAFGLAYEQLLVGVDL